MQLLLLCAPARALGEADVAASGLAGYCSEPPFASAGIKPNLLLMIDNSASMYDPAYTTPSTYCLDDSYQDGKSYSGYFDAGSSYQYDAAAGKFVAGAVLPAPPCSSGSCAASTGFLYLEMAAAVAPATYRTVKSFKASGNFLNWLTMSKLDVEKFLEIDTVLISSRHLYRMPYSLHEKSGLVSLPINPGKTGADRRQVRPRLGEHDARRPAGRVTRLPGEEVRQDGRRP